MKRNWPTPNIKNTGFRFLLKASVLSPQAKAIAECGDRMENRIKGRLLSSLGKKAHDELEAYYIPAMDFEAIENRDQLQQELWLEVQG